MTTCINHLAGGCLNFWLARKSRQPPVDKEKLPRPAILVSDSKDPENMSESSAVVSIERKQKAVGFSNVTTRIYGVVMAENPACDDGPAIGLDWEYNVKDTISVEYHQTEIGTKQDPSSAQWKDRALLSSDQRETILSSWGYDYAQMDENAAMNRRVQKQRERSYAKWMNKQGKTEQKLELLNEAKIPEDACAKDKSRLLCESVKGATKDALPAARKSMAFVRSQSVQMHVLPELPKSDDTRRFLSGVLSNIYLFQSDLEDGLLLDTKISMFVSAMQLENAQAGDIIIEQGSLGEFFYVIEEGKVRYVIDEENFGESSKGSSFGELALLFDAPRSASVIAATECKLWKIHSLSFRKILHVAERKERNQIYQMLNKVPLLNEMNDDEFIIKAKLSKVLVRESYEKGASIYKNGDQGDKGYIIESGSVVLYDIGQSDAGVFMHEVKLVRMLAKLKFVFDSHFLL